MRRDIHAYLYDIQQEVEKIERFTVGLTIERYEADERTRLAVELRFERIGEALVRAARNVEDIADVLPDARRMIAFRNVLIHNCSIIDNRQAWHAVQDVAALLTAVRSQLDGKSQD